MTIDKARMTAAIIKAARPDLQSPGSADMLEGITSSPADLIKEDRDDRGRFTSGGSSGETEMGNTAKDLSQVAERLGRGVPSGGDYEGHAMDHSVVAGEHEELAAQARAEGNEQLARMHDEAASAHQDAAGSHRDAAENGGPAEASANRDSKIARAASQRAENNATKARIDLAPLIKG